MNQLISTSLLGLLFLWVCGFEARANESTQPAPGQSVVEHYRADVSELLQRIKQHHPRPYRFFSERDFDRKAQALNTGFDEHSSQRDLLWSFSALLSMLGCGHSAMSYFNQEDALIEPVQRFPVDVRFVAGRLLVIDPLTNVNTLTIGDEIAAINGQAVPALMGEIYQHIRADMNLEAYKQHLFNAYATSYVTYALGFPPTYSLTTKSGKQISALVPLNEFSFKPLASERTPCRKPLCFTEHSDRQTGIITLRSFAYYGQQLTTFTDFMDDTFAAVAQKNITRLMIDVRGNHGGSGLAVADLLSRLTTRPFSYFSKVTDRRARKALLGRFEPAKNRFTGETYVLMDSDTLSAAPHFFALVKHHRLATLVGEPAGGNHSTNDGAQRFVSSAVGIEYKIATMRFDVDTPSLDIDQAITPDISIPYTAQQVLTGEDVMLNAALKNIER